MPELRDYLYLDLKRLEDYLSILEPTGEVQQLVQTIHHERMQAESMKKFGVPADGSGPLAEVTTERTMSVSAKHAFNRLYEKLSDSIIDIDETPAEVKKGSAVKVSRDFEPSPVAQMIKSLPDVLRMIMTSAEPEQDEEEGRMAALILDRLLKDSGEECDIPIIAKAPSPSYSVLFLADRQFILRGPAEMAGDMTLVGKARRVIPDDQELNLLSLPNVVPPGIRQTGIQDDDIVELFTDWPEELGPELDDGALTIRGPAIIVDALAVFT
jgi:hypothetical protein